MAWSKESRHKRGYGNAWDKLRKQILERDCGLCQVCATAGRVSIANAVDHIKPKTKGGTDAESNLQSICEPCHDIKTAADEGKTLRPKVTIGADGWPIATDV